MRLPRWIALALALTALAPASAAAAPTPTRAWGKNVLPGGPAGFAVCTTLCQAGQPGSDGGELGHTMGIALTPAGELLVVDNQNGRIVRYDSAGNYEGAFGSGFNDPGGIAVGPKNGQIYVADSGNNRVQRYSSAGVFLGAFPGTSDPDQLLVPAGLTTGPDGRVYVADTNHHRIVRFSAEGVFEAAWGSEGHGADQLEYPKDLAVDENGRIAVAEPYNRRVSQYTTGGDFVRAWGRGVRLGGSGSDFEVCDSASGCQMGATSAEAGGLGDTAWGIAADRAGSLYLADGSHQRVQQFTTSGHFVRAWGAGVATGAASFETCTSTCQTGVESGIAGGLSYLTDVAADCRRLFASDWGHYRIQAYSGAGTCPAVKKSPPVPPKQLPPPAKAAITMRVGKVRARRNGTARVPVRVSVAGRLGVSDTRKRRRRLKHTARRATKAGVVTLKLTPSRLGRRALRHRGRLRIRAKIVFRPAAGGKAIGRRLTVRLRLHRHT